ncbi:MAG: SprT-like domain-containing protein [Candidatus Thiodiazotropha sp. (ex Lucinoma kastoroae)]|nr:SprT-like domain-containing protein [Candidatus Thiodiazotropha sp. (ex Lucinoma kastoroae)]
MNSVQLQLRVTERTQQLLQVAESYFNISIQQPLIRFNLKGKTAGMILFPRQGSCTIRYNLSLLNRYGEAFINTTVPHEISHLIARTLHGPKIKPHGIEWKEIMKRFGASPNRCHNFSTNQTEGRNMRYFDYRCDCRSHRLSAIRHNRIQDGVIYLCQKCGTRLGN